MTKPLTQADIAQARVLAVEQEATLIQIRAQYDKQKKIMDEVQGRLRAAEFTLLHTRSIFAGIRRLPTELLGEIFMFHVYHNLQSPWVVMHVCRAWRAAALLTKTIWGAIMLTPLVAKKGVTGSRPRIIDGMEVCTKESQVQRALARAGGAALNLHIRKKRAYGSGLTWARYPAISIVRMLLCILNGEEKRKIRVLDIDIDDNVPLDFNVFDSLDFGRLEVLRLNGKYSSLIRKIKDAVVGLRQLSASASDVLLLENAKWLSQLEELEIRSNPHFIHVNGSALSKVLLSTTSLRSLTIQASAITDIMELKFDTNNLRRLVLYKISTFYPLECPNLIHLTIDCGWNAPERLEANSIHLPHLQVFHFICNKSLPCLRAFVVPALREFDLEGHYSKLKMRDGMQAVWKRWETPNINPVLFRFRNTTAPTSVFTDAISSMSRLEELRIEHAFVDIAFFQDLHPRPVPRPKKSAKNQQTEKNSSSWIVDSPKLKVLVLDLNGIRSQAQGADAYKRAAKDLLEMRKKANMPMERVRVRLTEEDGWMVFDGE